MKKFFEFFKKPAVIKTLLAILFIVLAIWGFKCARGNDFYVYYDAGKKFMVLEDNLYRPGQISGMINHYPPVFSMLMVPLALLPPVVAAYIFFVIKVLFTVWAFKVMPKLFPGGKVKPIVYALGFLTALRFFNDDFKLGQVNVLIFDFIIIGLAMFKDKKLFTAALFMVLATTIKIYPGIFLFYFLFRKEYKFVLISSVMLLVLNALPAVFYLDRFPPLFGYFLQDSIFNAASDPNSGIANQSIFALIMRFFGHNPTDTAYPAYVNFMNLGFGTLKMVFYAIGAISIAIVAIMAWKGNEKTRIFEIGVVMVIAVAFPMVSRKANFVFLMFPAMVVFWHMFEGKNPGQVFKILAWLAFGMLLLTSDGVAGRKLSNIFEALSFITIGAVLLAKMNGYLYLKGIGNRE